MKTLFAYTDFRTYLKDVYREQKSRDRSFSYATFAKRAGLGSPNYLKLVMDGSRRLTVANIHTFASALGLSEDAHRYFETLVLENQAESAKERRYYRSRLKEQRQAASLDVERLNPRGIMENPDTLALLVSAVDRDLPSAIRFATQEVGIPEERAHSGMEHLLKMGIIQSDPETGKLIRTTRHVMMSDARGRNEQQRQFIAQGLTELPRVFRKRYADRTARFLNLLLTAEPDQLDAIFDAMRAASEKVADQVDPKDPETSAMFRLQVQVYRMPAE